MPIPVHGSSLVAPLCGWAIPFDNATPRAAADLLPLNLRRQCFACLCHRCSMFIIACPHSVHLEAGLEFSRPLSTITSPVCSQTSAVNVLFFIVTLGLRLVLGLWLGLRLGLGLGLELG